MPDCPDLLHCHGLHLASEVLLYPGRQPRLRPDGPVVGHSTGKTFTVDTRTWSGWRSCACGQRGVVLAHDLVHDRVRHAGVPELGEGLSGVHGIELPPVADQNCPRNAEHAAMGSRTRACMFPVLPGLALEPEHPLSLDQVWRQMYSGIRSRCAPTTSKADPSPVLRHPAGNRILPKTTLCDGIPVINRSNPMVRDTRIKSIRWSSSREGRDWRASRYSSGLGMR